MRCEAEEGEMHSSGLDGGANGAAAAGAAKALAWSQVNWCNLHKFPLPWSTNWVLSEGLVCKQAFSYSDISLFSVLTTVVSFIIICPQCASTLSLFSLGTLAFFTSP